MTTSSEETVRRFNVFRDEDGALKQYDAKDGPYVLASALDAVVAERDALKRCYDGLLETGNEILAERDRLRQRVEVMQQAINHVARDSMLNEGGIISHEALSKIRALSGDK